jgi:hypothetical protein
VLYALITRQTRCFTVKLSRRRVLFPVLNTARIPSPLLLLTRILHLQDNPRNNH